MKNIVVVTTPNALSEKVITRKTLRKNSLSIRKGELLDLDTLVETLEEYSFDRVDFVIGPGQFSVRGGIVDLFSFSNDLPYRVEFFGDEVDSLRSFHPSTQLTINSLKTIHIVANIQDSVVHESRENFLDFISQNSTIWIEDILFTEEKIKKSFAIAQKEYSKLDGEIEHLPPNDLYVDGNSFREKLLNFPLIETGNKHFLAEEKLTFLTNHQPAFHKNFEMLTESIIENNQKNYKTYIFSDNKRQHERLNVIFEENGIKTDDKENLKYVPVDFSLHQGFVDDELKIACYTDHQIFDRYHRFKLRDNFTARETVTLKELSNLNKGDFVTHIDHGVGRFDGLETIENNGKTQEAIRLIYKNSDLLYVSIHALHKIAKFVGKEGTQPVLHKLGSPKWQLQKSKTKSKVKDIARELIALYAKRRAAKGFSFSADSYLQHELEASFIYDDTPDQIKTTQETKKDMEALHPMDRLVCGDVGFGKTEIAIRAAFKAVADNKQAAVLVPTTILAMQHAKTFSERLKEFPCNIDYISRFRTAKQQKQSLADLASGKTDIIIGTHKLLGKDIQFKDLGLLVVDEEQKFGVAAKEKLRNIRINVDTLTLTATPIPRTLQFSMMGARDLSVINTAPANRQPIQTEHHSFSEAIIRDSIMAEVARGGQVIFVHNRVQNITDVAGMIQRFCPDIKIAIGHGKMEGRKLERVMLDFMDHAYDMLIATTIVESGLDIPNVNTIFINDAHHFGLSDLHQIRGRAGRSNRRAFCHLIAPPLTALTDEARKRIQAILEFSNLGGGFNIAMRDMDIRGAGNLLGGEQSGFISDIGFQMYQKILDEALSELKEEEYKDLYKNENDDADKEYVKECQIDTDLEVMFPSSYINNTAERLSLYKTLDSFENEDQLTTFILQLEDRFGKLPRQVSDLMEIIRMRWIAKKIGIERLILRSGLMKIYFVANQNSKFYESKEFLSILNYIQQNPKKCLMKEIKGKLSLNFPDVSTLENALSILNDIADQCDRTGSGSSNKKVK